MSEDDLELLGQMVDRLDNLTYAAALPVPVEIHMKGMVGSIEGIRNELKAFLVGKGFNPWSDE
jgi:hypothetical protein